MKFNKKSLVKVTILSAILGLNGMCFGSVVNGAEVAFEDPIREELELMNIHAKQSSLQHQMLEDENVEEDEVPRCLFCFDEQKRLIKLGCCSCVACMPCLLEWNDAGHLCPVCKSIGNKKVNGKNVSREDIFNGTIRLLEEIRDAKTPNLGDDTPGGRNPKNAKKRPDCSNKNVQKPIELSDDFAIRLSTAEVEELGGKGAWSATFQNKYAQHQMSKLTDEKAWELFEQGKIREFEKMYDDAATYRLAQKMTIEDARDAILEKTSSNCPNNACCESERSQSTTWDNTNYSTSDYAPQGDAPVTVMIDGQEVTVD